MGDFRAIAEAFVDARRSARALPDYPGIAPQDLAGAYQIQDAAIAIDGRMIIGWKVGRINPPLDAELGANRLAGPIFADTVVVAADGVPEMPVFADGFAAAEAELLLHIAPGNADARPTTDAETRLVIDEVRLGIEIASSPYPGINSDGPAVTASDYGNNHGLVIGAPRRTDRQAWSPPSLIRPLRRRSASVPESRRGLRPASLPAARR